MKPTLIICGTALAMTLLLSACSGEAATADAENTASQEATSTAEDHDATAYVEDETGGLVDAAIVEALNAKLTTHHDESSRDIYIILGTTTEGRDVETVAEEMRAERGADALIYVAGSDRALAIVGDGLDEAFTDETENAMVAHFEVNELADGLNAGADAVIARFGE